MPRITPDGWTVTVTHPTTNRTIRPDVIAPDSVQYLPGPNTRPEIRIPVRRAPAWLREDFDDNPTLTVHRDCQELPIDELTDVELEEGRTVLVGEGGVELRTVVQAEYDTHERPGAATDLIDANTPYDTVDNTTTAPVSTQTVQDPSGETELEDLLNPAPEDPFEFVGGGVKPAQTCFTQEGENPDSGSDSGVGGLDGDYSGGAAATFDGASGDVTYEFNVDHVIPESEVEVYTRYETAPGNDGPGVDFYLDGTKIDAFPSGGGIGHPFWRDHINDGFDGGLNGGWSGGDLTPADNPHTFRIDATGGGTDLFVVDVVAPCDALTRITGGSDATDAYTFDDTVNTTDGYLDGPELRPTLDAIFDASESAFSVVGGAATATLTDTTEDQALALSNDRGATYPISGSNTTTVSGDFTSPGASLTLKATLSRYSPNGARDQTPRFGYDAQRLDAYTMDADIEAESLLIDETYDNDLESIVNDILGDQFIWAIRNINGTTTFVVDEPGRAVADRDPRRSETKITKRVTSYDTVTIKGSKVPVSEETFGASSSFINLAEDDILTGSEAVRDASGTQYTRGVDYAMNYQAGEIRALSGGGLTIGDSYIIDYRHQIKGSYTVGTPSDPDELIRTVPGVVSDRQAEQIAFVLADVDPAVAEPRYEGDILIPEPGPEFNPLEAFNLADLDIPDAARPLAIRGTPELTPLGLALRLGSAPPLDQALSSIRDQVSAVSDRV